MQTAIDFVVPMLFHDDAVWQRDYSETFGRELLPMDYYPLFRSWGTEELVIRGVLKFMPWIRTIHVILYGESQRQPWMEKYGDRIHVVYHRDYIPAEYLPCFNSCTIETFLGDIPGLAPMFIYGNDDVYPVAPMEPEDFFRGGKPCMSLKVKDYDGRRATQFERMCHNELELIAPDFGRSFAGETLRHGHALTAILRRTCKAVWQKHGAEMRDRVSAERTEHSISQHIYCYYQYLTGRYVEHEPESRLTSFWDRTDGIIDAVNDGSVKVVCVNDDNVSNSVWKNLGKKVYDAIEKRIDNTRDYVEEKE